VNCLWRWAAAKRTKEGAGCRRTGSEPIRRRPYSTATGSEVPDSLHPVAEGWWNGRPSGHLFAGTRLPCPTPTHAPERGFEPDRVGQGGHLNRHSARVRRQRRVAALVALGGSRASRRHTSPGCCPSGTCRGSGGRCPLRRVRRPGAARSAEREPGQLWAVTTNAQHAIGPGPLGRVPASSPSPASLCSGKVGLWFNSIIPFPAPHPTASAANEASPF